VKSVMAVAGEAEAEGAEDNALEERVGWAEDNTLEERVGWGERRGGKNTLESWLNTLTLFSLPFSFLFHPPSS